ncbi:amidohydrolase 2 [Russula earlei]|uniref:Amidohydrolase 2 n=1 Tax=Russula earlei TaxID=71964 RepID=A0ACC0TYM3_9AGAM|nr:amidohydrolase 2 [Russula earlei]
MTSATSIERIDIHHHFFPPSLSRLKAAQSQGVGFRTPPENLPWSANLSLRVMDTLGIQLAVLSLPSGALETADEARKANAMMHEIVRQHENRFAFWGCLGDWRDVEGALQLIPYVFDELSAVGIAVSSSYGFGGEARYIGDDLFDPIWSALNARNAIIFVHGTQTPSLTPIPHPTLGLPVTEVPHETFKAAAQLVVSGKTRRFDRLAFVLAHMGGSTLALAPRVAGLARYMGAPLSEDEILMEFRRYWWDTALSGSSSAACSAEGWGIGDHILWGSDFPAVSLDTIRWFDSNLEKGYQTNPSQLENIRRKNILGLFESRGVSLFTGRIPNRSLV